MAFQDLLDMINEFKRENGLDPTKVELGYVTYARIRDDSGSIPYVTHDHRSDTPIRICGLGVVKIDKPHHLKVLT